MSNLMKFMMTVIALALLAYLNSAALAEQRGEVKPRIVLSPEKKVPI